MQDNIEPKPKWEFDDAVTLAFEDMLKRSIPQYDVMRETSTKLATHYLPSNGVLVDLGCSRGDMIASFVKDYQCIGIDISTPMLNVAKKRFGDLARIEYCDLRFDYPKPIADVTLSILTLQFTPIEYRQQILRRVYEHTKSAFILIEKIIGATAEIDKCMVNSYYTLKAENGYTQSQIERKKLSLEGVLVPVTAKWNEELLHIAGFTQIDCFWRWMNFAGWLAIP